MKISELELLTGDLGSLSGFYARVLELPVSEEGRDRTIVRAGATRLVFQQASPGWSGCYHFAFDIPENRISDAKDWIARRVALIPDSKGKTEFDFHNWNAHSSYFYDPAGNILEFIARHNLPNASDTPFTAHCILNISEIGVATSDVKGTVQALQHKYGLPIYDGGGSDQFTAVGDENGLLIVVMLGRVWFPDTGKPAGPFPVKVTTQSENGEEQRMHFDFRI